MDLTCAGTVKELGASWGLDLLVGSDARDVVSRSMNHFSEKKADMLEQTQRFEHVGLLVNWLPGKSERPFI